MEAIKMFNPYSSNPYGYILPQQQIIQVNGRASVETMQLAPNSSLLAMDTSAPIVWMCVSDGIGKVTATPYDITVHKDAPPADVQSIEQRLAAIEAAIAEMEGRNGKSNACRTKPKQSLADDLAD
jgi:hypothetical protein